MGGTKILWLGQWGSHAQHIAPRPAGQYPDISLAPNNPWIAHPKIIIKSQDNYLLGKNFLCVDKIGSPEKKFLCVDKIGEMKNIRPLCVLL